MKGIFNELPSIKDQEEGQKRWKDCVDKDFAILKEKNWKSIAGRKAKWENLLGKAHKELLC